MLEGCIFSNNNFMMFSRVYKQSSNSETFNWYHRSRGGQSDPGRKPAAGPGAEGERGGGAEATRGAGEVRRPFEDIWWCHQWCRLTCINIICFSPLRLAKEEMARRKAEERAKREEEAQCLAEERRRQEEEERKAEEERLQREREEAERLQKQVKGHSNLFFFFWFHDYKYFYMYENTAFSLSKKYIYYLWSIKNIFYTEMSCHDLHSNWETEIFPKTLNVTIASKKKKTQVRRE